MIKTVLKVNGMMCGMCEAHMNDLVRKNFNVKKVTSSVKGGETVVISEENLDIPFLKKEIKEIDLIHGFGMTENNPYGLQKRFSGFMDNMTERGPYLTNPKEIKRYHKTLVD